MRNVKRLWGVIGCMALCLLVLISMQIASSWNQPEPTKPTVQQTAKDNERIVAAIGSRKITIGELETALEQHYGAELLNQIIDREAINLEGKETGISVTNAEIERELKRMQQGYESEGQFYESMKVQLGMSKEQLREDVYYKLLLDKLATRNITITDAQVEEYIQTHPDEFKSEVKFHIRIIVVSTKEQANKVLSDLAKGEDFATLARDRSLDDNTSNGGGDLGWIEENDPFVAAPIMNAAKQLQVGETSKPITVDNGYAIVDLRDQQEKPNPELSFIKENVRRELALRNAPPLKEIVTKLRMKWGSDIIDPRFK
jgi:foldase protein PrsA